MAKRAWRVIEVWALRLLRTLGRLTAMAPRGPRATGGYGLAFRGGLNLLFLIGLAVAWPARGAGLAIMIVAALAMLQYYVLQYRGALLRGGPLAWLVGLAVVLGAIVAAVWSTWSDGDGTAGDVMVLGAVIGSLALLPIVRVLFRLVFGPHHPESAMPEPSTVAPLWYWVGGVGPNDATVVARVAPGSEIDSVVVTYTDGTSSHPPRAAQPDGHRFARIALTGLHPDSRYALRVSGERGGEPVCVVTGGFTTFPPHLGQSDVCLVLASCASTGSKGRVFDAIRAVTPRPQAFVVMGDLHYENITADEPERYYQAYDAVHSSHPQRRLYREMPVAYVWDDHDFGDNNSDHSSPSRNAAWTAYRKAVPSYLEPDRSGAIYQEFSLGRVRVVMTDNRSERGQEDGNLLTRAQEDWLVQRITDPAWPLVIWVSPTPWISDDPDSDDWGRYSDQRERIASRIGDRNRNLVSVSGDAHMVAIDDGTNAAYAGPGSGFPVLNAASLDRQGSVKGAEFTGGKFPGAGQFGVITVNDRGEELAVELTGRNWTGGEIVRHAFTIAVGPGSGAPSTETE